MEFEYYRDKKDEWRWRLVASNNKVVADSGEGYESENAVKEAIGRIRGGAAMATVVKADG